MSEVSKIALITGANKGIGFEIARQLGVQGITILVGVRNLARGEAAVEHLRAEAIDAIAIHLDVTNQATIDAAAAFIDQTYGKRESSPGSREASLTKEVVCSSKGITDASQAHHQQ